MNNNPPTTTGRQPTASEHRRSRGRVGIGILGVALTISALFLPARPAAAASIWTTQQGTVCSDVSTASVFSRVCSRTWKNTVETNRTYDYWMVLVTQSAYAKKGTLRSVVTAAIPNAGASSPARTTGYAPMQSVYGPRSCSTVSVGLQVYAASLSYSTNLCHGDRIDPRDAIAGDHGDWTAVWSGKAGAGQTRKSAVLVQVRVPQGYHPTWRWRSVSSAVAVPF